MLRAVIAQAAAGSTRPLSIAISSSQVNAPSISAFLNQQYPTTYRKVTQAGRTQSLYTNHIETTFAL